ncbi:hypothetical protein D8674_034324 [Pyrus ussuriensis x Pyrus communis]|uniref:Uncharacterized protein n=1 Tax=Pyrus ussuriensis x Pyrus communis TaxID=2448454 RepID=A0A5N5HNP3_9ROSA|nr:hypothetical protein D8674_034324 [Pyrus ussuriensis x Pyrus communis]
MPSIANLLYLRLKIPMQFKDVEIMKNITQPMGQLVRLDNAFINSLNAMAIMVLIDVDVRLPLKQVLGDDPNMQPDEDAKGLGLALPDTKDDKIFCFLLPKFMKENGLETSQWWVQMTTTGQSLMWLRFGPQGKGQDLVDEGAGCSHVVGEN